MKKTEILKVRVDAYTHEALVRFSESQGRAISSVVRDLLERELMNTDGDAPKPRLNEKGAPDVMLNGQMRVCARILASILVGQRGSSEGHEGSPGRSIKKEDKVLRLLEALLRTLSQEEGRPTPLARPTNGPSIADHNIRQYAESAYVDRATGYALRSKPTQAEAHLASPRLDSRSQYAANSEA